MRVRVSPLEKKYVFEALDQYGIGYTKEELYIHYCIMCGKIWREKPETDDFEDLHNIETAQLGDIIGWNYNYIIERKKENDLLASLNNERLYIQLRAISELFNGCGALVFEGRFKDVINNEKERIKVLKAKKGLSKKQLIGTNSRLKQLMSIPATCNQYGVSFIQIDDIDELMKMLKYFDYKCGSTPKIRVKRKPIYQSIPPFMQLLVRGVDGIGLKYATNVYQKYKSAEDLVPALKNGDILKIKGIGKSRAKLLRSYFLNE